MNQMALGSSPGQLHLIDSYALQLTVKKLRCILKEQHEKSILM